MAKIYKLGVGNDKRRQRKSDAEKQAAYRTKKKQIKVMEMLTSCSAPSVEREPTPLKLEPQLVD